MKSPESSRFDHLEDRDPTVIEGVPTEAQLAELSFAVASVIEELRGQR